MNPSYKHPTTQRLKTALYLCVLMLSINLLAPLTHAQEIDTEKPVEIITDIKFFGLKRIRSTAIFAKLESRVGNEFSTEIIDRDLHRLHAWNQFVDIQVIKTPVEDGKVKVEFQFVERSFVSGIVFIGRVKIKTEILEDLLTTEVGAPLRAFTLLQDAEAIKQKYIERGYSLVDIEVQRAEDGQGGVQVLFKISEGPKLKIDDVAIHGNHAFSDRRLARFMQNRKKFLFLREGKFNFDLLENDMRNLTSMYRSHGFLDAAVQVEDVNFDDTMKKVKIDINVEEGERYYIKKITFDISGDAATAISKRELHAAMRLYVSGPLLWEDLQTDQRTLKLMYGAIGRTRTRVNIIPAYHENENTVDLRVRILVSEEIYINKIIIRGNHENQGKVIRRELSVFPGERFNEEEFKRSLARLRSLRFFERINHDFLPSDAPGLYDLIIEVVEQKTGRFQFGGAIDVGGGGIFGFITYTQPNFDLQDRPKKLSDWLPGHAFVGAGQRLQLKFQPGTRLTQIVASFREPYLFDQPIGLNLNASIQILRFIDSRVLTSGFSIGVDRRYWHKFIIGTRFNMKRQDLHNVREDAPEDVFAIKGVNFSNSLTLLLSYTDIDNFALPSRGYKWDFSYEYTGGILGGDFDYNKIQGGFKKFYTLYQNDEDLKHILEIGSRFGYIVEHSGADDVPITARFFAGGLGSVRGFDFWELGPRQNGEPVGGNISWISTIEYTFPMPQIGDVMRGALFLDAGNLARNFGDFNFSETRVAIGFGVRVKIPFLGSAPVQIDLGFPIKKEKDDNTRLINFGLQRTF